MPWPSSLVLLSAIAAATTRLRLAACAVIAPLRHPLLLARELGTLDLLSEGRLVVQPTVSWHRDEYEALGVPFRKRGAAARRAPCRVGGALARHAVHLRRRALRLRERLPRAEGVAPGRAAALARRRVGAPAAAAPDRSLRPRLSSAGAALRRRPDPAPGRARGSGARHRGARARRRHARRLPGRPQPVARSTPRSIRSRRSSSAASRRSASSRRSSSTRSTPIPRGATRWSSAWPRSPTEAARSAGHGRTPACTYPAGREPSPRRLP